MKKWLLLPAIAIFAWAGYVYSDCNGAANCRRVVNPFIEVTRGMVPSQQSIFKFGTNSEVSDTQEDIWSHGNNLLFYPETAQEIQCTSTDPDDNVSGTGARTALIKCLDGSWLHQEETFVLDGVTEVVLDNYCLRVNGLEILTAGSSGINEGQIVCSAVIGGVVASSIAPSMGSDQMAAFTVPGDKAAVIIEGSFSAGKGDDMKVTIYKRSNSEDVFPDGAWNVCLVAEVYQNDFILPRGVVGLIPGKTDIRFSAIKETGVQAAPVSAMFTVQLFDA